MLNVVGIEYGQLNGVANAVVGTERGALGVHPVALDISLDGILREVEVHVHELVAYHVHVALEDSGGAILVALGRGLAYNHVTGLVDLGLKAVALAKLLEILDHASTGAVSC